MDQPVDNGNGLEKQLISDTQRKSTKDAINKLFGINLLSFGLSAVNEVVIGHSALGFTQGTMEATDTVLAKGLSVSERNDANKKHRRASRQRQSLYGLHIFTAGVGIAEGARLISEGAEPNLRNLAVSGIVGAINAHYLYHRRQHRRGLAHTTTPTIKTAFNDPIEVIQDNYKKYPNRQEIHRLNENGTTAIAYTNIIEAASGLGVVAQYGWGQASAVAAITSSAGVIGVMSNQIRKESKLLNHFMQTDG